MTGKRWLVAAAAGLLAAGSGCVSCRPDGVHAALEAGPQCQLPAWERQRVYVFLVNGVTPVGLCSLRDRLNAEGFPKVAYGQMYHAAWMAGEMRRTAADDPDARFVVVGYDMGGAVAARLAADAAADGLTVDALVLLDPVGKPRTMVSPVRTVLVCSKSAAPTVPHAEAYSVPDAGHFCLPSNPQTVAILARLLHESAGRVVRPLPGVEVTEVYEHAPPARVIPVPGPTDDPAWTFLLDVPGNHTTPLLPADSHPAGVGKSLPVPATPVSVPRTP